VLVLWFLWCYNEIYSCTWQNHAALLHQGIHGKEHHSPLTDRGHASVKLINLMLLNVGSCNKLQNFVSWFI
jgi:hypothetical protein